MCTLAALGIPEVWTYDGDELHFFRRRDGVYESVEYSKTFSAIAPDNILRFLDLRSEMEENAMIREFTKWLAGEGKRP